MTTIQDQNKATIARFNTEFIQNGNEAVWRKTIAPDFINRSAAEGAQDRDAAFHWFTQVLRPAFPDLIITIHDQIAEGDTVVTRKSYTATHRGPFLGVPPTGKIVNFSVIDIIRLQHGTYVEHWANADMFGLLHQLKAD